MKKKIANKRKQDLTVFVITTGEKTYNRCIQAINNQSTTAIVDTIENISPMNRAFQEMLNRCKTKYYVQVDADMILHPHAIETMQTRFKALRFTSAFTNLEVAKDKIAMLYFPLIDVHLERQIIGVKIYNHEIMRNYPYEADFSCEVTQIDRLKADGYHIAYQDCIVGLHGTEWTTHQIFERYKRLFQKKNIYGSGNHNYDWLNPYPKKFFNDYLKFRNPLDLWAYQGAIAGISQTKDGADGEQTFDMRDTSFEQMTALNVGSHMERDQDSTYFPNRASFGQYVYGECDLPAATSKPPVSLRICFVTTELPGFGPHGGIATAFKLLADFLVLNGHSVYILFVTHDDHGSHLDARSEYFYNHIKVEVLTVHSKSKTPWNLEASSSIKYWLAERNFDVVHFPEYKGLAFYSLLSKRQGYNFETTNFCLQAHGPSQQLIAFNNDWDVSIESQLIIEHCEKRSIEMADFLVSPSRYLIEWFISNRFNLPANTFCLKNIPPLQISTPNLESNTIIREIVFFGKQIELKGVLLFCDAIDRLDLSSDYKITFLGRPARVNFQDSLGYIAQRAVKWNTQISFELEVTPEYAMSYCSQADRLIVIPSLIENSPYVVMECLSVACQFIASDVGGLGELIAESDREKVLFSPDPDSLAYKIQTFLSGDHCVARPSYNSADVSSSWLAFHSQLNAMKSAPLPRTPLTPLACSVCISHFNRPQMLRQCINSILFQKNVLVELIVIDDGSSAENCEAIDVIRGNFSAENVKWVFQANSGLAATRNRGADEASHDLIFFLDDDDLLLDGSLEKMIRVAHATDADIVVGSYKAGVYDAATMQTRFEKFSTKPDFLGLGPSLEMAMLGNFFGPSFCLVRKKSFLALGGFTATRSGPYEDWEFYHAAVLAGAKLELIAEPLFVYSAHASQMTNNEAERKNINRVLGVCDDFGILSRSLEWSVRHLRKQTYTTNNHDVWKNIDNSPDVDLIRKINSGAISAADKLDRVRDFFQMHGQSVQLASNAKIYANSPHATRPRTKVTDQNKQEGLVVISRELCEVDPKRATTFIDERIKEVEPFTKNWKMLLYIRAKCHIKIGAHASAMIDMYDAGLDKNDMDAVAGLAVTFACAKNIDRYKEYEKLLSNLEENQYLKKNIDVKTALINCDITNPREHYLLFGKKEGRTWPTSAIFGDLVDLFRKAARATSKVTQGKESTNV